MNFLFKFRLRALEKQLAGAERKSYYTDEAAGMRVLGRLTRAFQDGDYRSAVVLGYELASRYDDLNTGFHYLARALEKLGENELALKHYWSAVVAGRKALDTIDDQHVDEMLRLASTMGSLDRVRGWFEDMGRRDPKARKYLERMQRLGKL